jgi:uncharacterized protein (TIGR00369 family)
MALTPGTPAYDGLIAFFEQGIPFNAWLGMKVERLEPGLAVVRIPFRPELVGDPTRPALHGGVLSTLADTAGGLAAFAMLDNPLVDRVSTLDLLVDYLLPARPEDLWCEARLVRLGNKVAQVHMTIRQGDDHVCVEGRAVYNVIRRS